MRDTQVRDASRWRLSVSVIDGNAHFVFPEFIFFDKCVEDRESLPHAGDETDFLLFALGESMLVVALDSLIEAYCHSRGHVKTSSDVTSSSADKSFSHEGSVIAVNGRDSDPLCDCRIANTSEFWNSRRQRCKP